RTSNRCCLKRKSSSCRPTVTWPHAEDAGERFAPETGRATRHHARHEGTGNEADRVLDCRGAEGSRKRIGVRAHPQRSREADRTVLSDRKSTRLNSSHGSISY